MVVGGQTCPVSGSGDLIGAVSWVTLGIMTERRTSRIPLRSFAASALAGFGAAVADERVDVPLAITYSQTQVGQSVFVLGDLPELGGGDITRAVKLEPTQWPLWKGTFSLPAGRNYTYQFYRRNDGPGTLGSTSGTIAIGSPISASTPGGPMLPVGKAVLYHSGLTPPVLWWREAGVGAYRDRPMTRIGPGRSAGEWRWIAWDLESPGGHPRRTIEFYFTGPSGTPRDPADGTTYLTPLDGLMVQDGHVYSYVPAPAVGASRRDYTVSTPPGISSSTLGGELRRYRVFLPRGYDQHPARRYPVLYLHDGQNVFDQGPFGTWDADDTSTRLIRQGRLREIIMVGVDNTSNRFANYVTPDDGGQADRYARFIRDELKPLIDAQYRTLPGADDTGAMGSSLGGVVSLYMGWDFTSTFRRIGAMSGSWQLPNFPARVGAQPRRAIRLYLDSGDAGASSDNYWPTFNLRDSLLAKTPGYALEGDLRHRVGLGHQHNEAAWAARLPEALAFLFPVTEGENPLLGLATGQSLDVNGDGGVDVEDLYTQAGAPGVGGGAGDLNQDAAVDHWDALTLAAYLRRAETADQR